MMSPSRELMERIRGEIRDLDGVVQLRGKLKKSSLTPSLFAFRLEPLSYLL